MVLSNKKLKQKRRADLAANSTTQLSNAHNEEEDDNTTTQKKKPRLTKREKRREKKRTTLDLNDQTGDSQMGKEGKGNEARGEKKRKRGNEGDDSNAEEVEKKKKKKGERRDGDGEIAMKEEDEKKKNNKKKKKKTKKTIEKVKEVEVEKKGDFVPEPEANAEKMEEKNLDVQESTENLNKVYVGGIPYYSTEDDIRSFFDHCGTITEVDCMKFPESGKFRGIAIISFKTQEAAKRALALDGADMGGLLLKIEQYKATRDTKASSDFAPPIVEGYNRIYVGNLSWDITEEDLRKLFSDCVISSIRFGEDKETGEFKGYTHVDFSDKSSLTKALTLDQRVVCGRPVRIRCAVQKKAVNQKKDVGQKKAVEAQDSSPAQMAPKANDDEANVNDGGLISKKIKGRTCYECGERGHISSLCPKKQVSDQTKS